jgi:hypothetical protein
VRRLSAAAFAASLVALATGPALAETKSPQADTRATLQEVEARKADAAIAAEPIASAKKALDRSKSARDAGDRTGATLLARLAREWASLARSLLRAVDAERKADALEERLADTETKAVRARALLEETLARRGRAQEELRRIGNEPDSKPEPPPAPEKKP